MLHLGGFENLTVQSNTSIKKQKSLSCLKKYIKKYFVSYLIGFAALIFVNLILLQFPMITGRITDGLRAESYSLINLRDDIILLLVLGLLVTVGRFIWRYFIFGTSRKIEYGLRGDFFWHLEKLSLRFFNEHKTGDLMAHATNDLNAIRMMVGPGVLMVLDAVILTLLVVSKMLIDINVTLTLFAIIPLPIITVASTLLGKIIKSRFKEKQEAFSRMTEMVQENISGIRIIKAFVQEAKEICVFNKTNQNNYNKNMRVVKLFALLFPLANLITGLSIALALGYGGYLTMIGQLSLGRFVAFIQYILMLVWPMLALGWCINIISQGTASLKRFQIILNEQPDIYDNPNTKAIHHIDGSILFKNLTFMYPNTSLHALNQITLTIKQGQTLGIVGRTGSGKTTLVNLLLRLFDPPRGTIYIDGHDILDIPLKVLRNHIGYVPQDNFLFSETIERNISFAFNKSYSEQVIEAAKKANVHENIAEFPMDYQTMIGERGVTLSGGQKQRISLARALMIKAPIMILDDSVSAVDTKTEEKILQELVNERKNKTTLIIAHRLSTIKNADKIIVIDDGRIVESGTHDELLLNKSIYYDMFQLQQLELAEE